MYNDSNHSVRQNGGPCIHIIELKDEDLLACYELLHAFYVVCIKTDSFERKENDCLCNLDSCRTKIRVHACLSCIHFGCFDHIPDHAREMNHPLAVELDFGRIFCCECNDYKYDHDFEKISQNQKLIASRRRATKTGLIYKWEPSVEELNILKHHKIVYHSETGTRGLVNIANLSCYMNVIVQSFIHAPMYRDYLLSLRHRCKNQNATDPACFMCEMSEIVQECYSGESEPYALGTLLYLYWKRVKGFAELKFEDAHLFFMDLLEHLHEDCEEKSHDSCKCIIHTIFGFSFRKECICNNCKNVDIPPAEPYAWDIKLALEPSDNSGSVTVSFDDCLKRALQEEISGYFCTKCSKNTGCTSKLIPEKLPIVMSFCLNQPMDKRNKSFIEFEEILDMSPYMFPSNIKKKGLKPSGILEYMYYLFAVVEYVKTSQDNSGSGNSEEGHYKCYIRRHKRRWILCNDDKIEPIAIENVLRIKARMLFYHRMYLNKGIK